MEQTKKGYEAGLVVRHKRGTETIEASRVSHLDKELVTYSFHFLQTMEKVFTSSNGDAADGWRRRERLGQQCQRGPMSMLYNVECEKGQF